MSGRPEVLYPLFASLESLPGIGKKTAKALEDGKIATPRDLLFNLPYGGTDRRRRPSLAGAEPGTTVTVEVAIGRHQPPRTRGRPYQIEADDGGPGLTLVFFHASADYLRSTLPEGARRIVSGRLDLYDGRHQMVHPDHILSIEDAASLQPFEPIYHLTGTLTPRTMMRAIRSALDRAPHLPEWIDPALKADRGWPGWLNALRTAHAPASARDLAPDAAARERLAYDELLAHQMTLAIARARDRTRPGIASVPTGRLQARVLAALPYRPTAAQERVSREIQDDMAAPRRMIRLLQGDVGSGKTLVAILALLTAVEAGGQGALMAPTELLARQHLANLRPLAEAADVVLDILTGRDTGTDRNAKRAAIADGRIQIVVGTHALFQAGVEFADLRLAVIDEQHRFGVAERLELTAKGRATDTLVMTATPIPRSLALAQYGHMDVSVLDGKPPGRTPVTTALSPVTRLPEIVDHLRAAICEGRQAYWVCPLVEECEASDLTAASERFARLRAALGEGKVGIVHGRMSGPEKDSAMEDFATGRTRVLVATTVIEVGVDVPNASIMVIERAERFGLAQLHQLRGRVGRGADASTCLLVYQPPLNDSARRRLTMMRDTDDGFLIAEEDMALRGAGDVIGTAQSGLPRFRIADLDRQGALMATAQTDARNLVATDPTLETERGRAARLLLWLMERDRAIRLLDVG